MPIYEPNTKIGNPSQGDVYPPIITASLALLDGLSPVGGLCVSPRETPSTSLNVAVAAGAFRTPWGQTVTYAGAASQAVTASASTFVWLTVAGVLTVGSAWPVTAYVPLAGVTASAAAVTGIVDARNVCSTVVPIAQPTMGAATAGASWTSAEQGMVQTMWNLLRALGMGT